MKIVEFIQDLFQTKESKLRKRLYMTLSQLKKGQEIGISLNEAQSNTAVVTILGNDPESESIGFTINWQGGEQENKMVGYDSYHFKDLFVLNTFSDVNKEEKKGIGVGSVLDKMLKEELDLDK